MHIYHICILLYINQSVYKSICIYCTLLYIMYINQIVYYVYIYMNDSSIRCPPLPLGTADGPRPHGDGDPADGLIHPEALCTCPCLTCGRPQASIWKYGWIWRASPLKTHTHVYTIVLDLLRHHTFQIQPWHSPMNRHNGLIKTWRVTTPPPAPLLPRNKLKA